MQIFVRLFAAATCISACILPVRSALAEAPMVKTQAPGFYRVLVGDFELTALSDGTNPLPATRLLQGDSAQITQALKANFLTETVETSHNSFLINTGSKLVLVDAGAGTSWANVGDLLNNARRGYRPEQIDEVYLTPHTDHVGGLVANGHEPSNAVVRDSGRSNTGSTKPTWP